MKRCGGSGRPSFSSVRTDARYVPFGGRPCGLLRGRYEDALLRVGRPAWPPVAGTVRELARFAGIGGDGPDGGVVTVLLVVHGNAHESDMRAIGRDLRIADPDEVEEILFSDISLLGQCRRSDDDQESEDTNQENRDTKTHVGIPFEWCGNADGVLYRTRRQDSQATTSIAESSFSVQSVSSETVKFSRFLRALLHVSHERENDIESRR